MVIRRILRRCSTLLLYVTWIISSLYYYQLVPGTGSAQFSEAVFPELHQQLDFVSKVVKEEEEAFLRTLDKGLKKIDELVAGAKNKTINGRSLPLSCDDTYGFPVDLTRLIAGEQTCW